MLAASTQQNIGLLIVVIAVVGWILWILANVRRAKPEVGAEIELAPNRKPYYTDEELEGSRLERAQLLGLVFLIIIGVGLPLYWLAEPGRQEGAIEYFQERAASDATHHGQPVGGEALFAPTAEGGFNCAGCHGGLDGGSAPYTVTNTLTGKPERLVLWPAPALRYVALRMDENALREVLVYGRPYSPMPAWGLEGGGPLNAQQIDNLIAYLQSVSGVPPYTGAAENAKKAKVDAVAAAESELERMKTLPQQLATEQANLAAATSNAERTTIRNRMHTLETEIALNQDKTLAAALFNVNCARCHTFGWSAGDPHEPGTGGFGPRLYNVLNQFPPGAEDDHIAFVTDGVKFGQRYGILGKSSGRMPFFGQVLTKEQIELIVGYEREIARQATARAGS